MGIHAYGVICLLSLFELFKMFSCWALAHGCYVVQVKARESLISLDLESSAS